MKPLLIIGLDTIIGANAGAVFAQSRDVIGLTHHQLVNVSGIQPLGSLKSVSPAGIGELLDQQEAAQIVYVIPQGSSAWFTTETQQLDDSAVDDARSWSMAAQKRGIPLTLVSSDTVFTGPWMFHEEDSTGLNANKSAVVTRSLESEVLAWHPDALVIRTNAFGWTPESSGMSWIESLVMGNIQSVLNQVDTMRNGTPILASELCSLMELCWTKQLSGIYHIAGAERCHPVRLAQKVCEVFGLSWKGLLNTSDQQGARNSLRFGFGETSLQTRKIRQALQVPMPMLEESVEQFYAEYQNGFVNQIRPMKNNVTSRAA